MIEQTYRNRIKARLGNGDGDDGGRSKDDVVRERRTRTKLERPPLFKVILLNDDYTPMEFVISILQAFFNKDPQEATQIMLQVHHNGVGECGVYTYEIAETKVSQVMDHARKNQHPLQCIMEKK